MFLRRFIIIVVLTLCFAPFQARAQGEDSIEAAVQNDLFDSLSPDLQAILLEEMDVVYEECSQTKWYSVLHDCRCLSVKYLDERLIQGPEFTRTQIMADIAEQCVNTESIAGNAYQDCLEMNTVTSLKDVESYCECYANELATRYTRKPFAHRDYFMRLGADAHSACSAVK